MSYGTRIMNSSQIQIHRELEEAAHVAGGSTWSVGGVSWCSSLPSKWHAAHRSGIESRAL